MTNKIKSEQVPDEVEVAFRVAWLNGELSVKGAIAAALSAWPGFAAYNDTNEPGDFLLLPLTTQEPGNE